MSKASFTKPSNLPIAVPVNNDGYYDPSTPAEVSLVDKARANVQNTLLLILFNALTMGFSIVAFVLVLVGFVVSVSLLPVCCIGVVALGAFWLLLEPLANVDEFLFLKRKALYKSIHRTAPTTASSSTA